MDVPLKPMEHLIFRSELALYADFACAPDEPLYADSGPSNAFCFIFPSTSTRILRRGRPSILENPAAVSLLNRGEEYQRQAVTRRGTYGTWFTLADELLEELWSEADRREGGFREPQIAVAAETILLQRRILHRLGRTGTDRLATEEALVDLARTIMRAPGQPRSNHRLVQQTMRCLLINYSENVSLSEIARNVGASPAYLSRVFRATTGMTMTVFRQRLRLIASLDLLPSHAGRLTDLALDLGYSSHSHFTSAFRELFGVSPRRFLQP